MCKNRMCFPCLHCKIGKMGCDRTSILDWLFTSLGIALAILSVPGLEFVFFRLFIRDVLKIHIGFRLMTDFDLIGPGLLAFVLTTWPRTKSKPMRTNQPVRALMVPERTLPVTAAHSHGGIILIPITRYFPMRRVPLEIHAIVELPILPGPVTVAGIRVAGQRQSVIQRTPAQRRARRFRNFQSYPNRWGISLRWAFRRR